MGQMQGIQGHQAIQTLNNDIYDSAGSNSSSSYVSTSGIKSVLLHAWNAVKSAVSGMLSSFGSHLTGQQGSDKPERKMSVDISLRPVQPLPVDIQFDNDIYNSCDGNIDDSVYAGVSARLSLSGSLYSEIEEPLYEEIGNGQDQTPLPVNLATHPSLSASAPDLVYEEIGEGMAQTPPPVNLSTHPSLSASAPDLVYEEIGEGMAQTPPPVPDSPRPSLWQTLENALYESRESLYDNASG
ncbi:TPA: hypothetical protein KV183_001418 [Morganella morganii]|nr:hypothetical protein [Morganella morganii]